MILNFIFDRVVQYIITKHAKSFPVRFQRFFAMYYPDKKIRRVYWELTRVSFGNNSYPPLGMKVMDDQDDPGVQLFIGDNVSMGPNPSFICFSSPDASPSLQENHYVKSKLIKKSSIIIENDVWIGANVTILPGIKIGKMSIIGAGSVLTRDVEPFSIVAGIPAKLIRNII